MAYSGIQIWRWVLTGWVVLSTLQCMLACDSQIGVNPNALFSQSSRSVDIVLKEVDGQDIVNAPFTVSQPFKDDEFYPGEVSLYDATTGKELPVQVDVLRTNEKSGSIRLALLSFIIPQLSAHAELTVQLRNHPANVQPPAFEWSAASESVNPRMILTGTNGSGTSNTSPNMYASLRDIVGDPKTCQATPNNNGDYAYKRFDGPIMKECVVWAKMRHCNGACTNTSTTTSPQLDYSYRIRFFTGYTGVKVELVVENTHVKLSPTDATTQFLDHYFSSATFHSGSNLIWQSSQSHSLWAGTRWRFVGYHGTPFVNPEIHWDTEYLYQGRFFDKTGAAPAQCNGYNNNQNIPCTSIDQFITTEVDVNFTPQSGQRYVHWASPNLLSTLPSSLGNTGGGWYIGPNTDYALYWYSTQERKALEVIQNIDSNPLSSNYEVHYRPSASGAKQAPGGPVGVACTLQSNGVFSTPWNSIKPPIANSPHTPDVAHQPRVGFSSYLMTGDLYYLEEMMFWEMWNTSNDGPGFANDPSVCIINGPERATAWSGTRAPVDAAYILPNEDAHFEYMQQVVERTANYWASRTYQTNKTIHITDESGNGDSLSNSGRVNYINASRFSPWQYAWMCWAFELAAKRGYEGYRPIADWVCKLPMDLLSVENDRSQDFTIIEADRFGTPHVNTYSFPASQAHAYSLAKELYYTVQASTFNSNPAMCISQNESAVTSTPKRTFTSYGELFYWTLINESHGMWPQFFWCTNDFCNSNAGSGLSSCYAEAAAPTGSYTANGTNWNIYNGYKTGYQDYSTTNHQYAHEPSTVAFMEAAFDESSSTGGTSNITTTQAQQARDRYMDFVGTPTAIDIIPGVLR